MGTLTTTPATTTPATAATGAKGAARVRLNPYHLAPQDHAADYEPRRLLCNGTYISAELDRLDKADRDSRSASVEELAFIYVSTPAGGSEYRPMGRFDRIPSNPIYATLSRTHRKPTFFRVPEDPAQDAPLPNGPRTLVTQPHNAGRRLAVVGAAPTPPTPRGWDSVNTPADPAPEAGQDPAGQVDAVHGPLFVRIKGKKGRWVYSPLADGEDTTGRTLFRREGQGKATRYVELGA